MDNLTLAPTLGSALPASCLHSAYIVLQERLISIEIRSLVCCSILVSWSSYHSCAGAMAKYGSQTSRYNRLVTVFVALGSLTYGYCASIIGSTIGQPGWYRFFNLPREGQPGYATTTTHAIATANGLFSTGGAVGALFIMWSADFFGRKRNIQFGSLLAIVGGAFQGGAAALAMFQVGRFISGLGIGILVTVCPMYLSEMSSPFVRGWLVGHHASKFQHDYFPRPSADGICEMQSFPCLWIHALVVARLCVLLGDSSK